MLDKKSDFRVIVSNQNSAKENMAIDESLLKNFSEEKHPIFRLYTWDENSLTVGISQNIESYNFLDYKKEKSAKRITGGGVLFHGHDLSYSLVIPTELLKGLSIKESYEKICQFILEFYKTLGLDVCYAKDNKNITLSKNEYCQVGFEAYDILANGQKIGGNAQKRTKKAIFQHGSIPVKSTKSNTFDKRVGVSLEDLDIDIGYEEAIKLLISSFEKSFNVKLLNSDLTDNEIDTKNSLLKEKYDKAC